MTKTNKINYHRLDINLSLLDPLSENFSFELWAAKVARQMKNALETKSTLSRTPV